jgi:hypothetical protein
LRNQSRGEAGACTYSDDSGTILLHTCWCCTHVAIMNEKEESIVQDPIEPIIAQEEELQQKCQLMKAPEGLKELENQLSLKTTKSMLAKKFKWKVIPSHLKKS